MNTFWARYNRLKIYMHRNLYNYSNHGDLGVAHLFYLERISMLDLIK